MAIAQTCEITWIYQLFDELRLWFLKPTSLYCDNISDIHLTNNLVFYQPYKPHKIRLSFY